MISQTSGNWSSYIARELSDEQFHQWRKLVEQKTGMLLPEHRKIFLQSSLNIRMKEISCDSYDKYFEILSAGMSGEVEWAILVDRLTVHETSFFRHKESFDLVEKYFRNLLPAATKENKPLTLWSVGCSTGEEPYSLVLLLEDLIRELSPKLSSKPYYGITATDISLPSLATARDGKYTEKRLFGLRTHQKKLIFDKVVGQHFQVKQKYKDKICFARVNLLELEQLPVKEADLLFCQNVLIYFQKERKYKIIDQLCRSLAPGGLLVLGLGDLTEYCPPDMRRVKVKDVLAFTKKIK